MGNIGAISLQQAAKSLGGEVIKGKKGDYVACPGPNHSAKDRSLSVSLDARAPDGFVVNSFADNDPLACKDHVRSRLGLERWEAKSKRNIVATYDYKDRDGTLLYQVVRYDPKDFRQRRPDGAGGWIWKLEDRRVIYRWPEIDQWPDDTVYLVEGEKDADRMLSLGFCATTVAGDGKWSQECIEALGDRQIIILEDNDEKGRKRGAAARAALTGSAASLMNVRLPGLRPGGDISDWLNSNPSESLVDFCIPAKIEDDPVVIESPVVAANGRWQDTIAQDKKIKTANFRALFEEPDTPEQNYIEPNFAGPGQFVVIAGPPKAQKSFVLQEMLVACATGTSFLANTFTVPRPLRVFYLQAEMNRALLKKRAKEFQDITPAEMDLLGQNFVVSERFHMLLSEEGVNKVVTQIKEDFPNEPPDVLAFDPLANLFDGDDENSNSQLLKFLMTRLEAVRLAVNPMALIVLTHHSKKVSREDLGKDPFSAIRGAGALRGYYDSAIVLFRMSEESKTRQFHFEMRSGEAPDPLQAILTNGRFRPAPKVGEIDKPLAKRMLGDLKEAWERNQPWSPNPQAKTDGRCAAYNLSRAYQVKHGDVSAILNEWTRLGIIEHRERVSRKHPAGYEVIGNLD